MKVDSENDLYLLVDIDDFLVFSSPKLQAVVDEKTNFKTEVLQMFEQLNRNCRYVVNEVTKECELAKIEKRKPQLKRFMIFDNYVCDTDEQMYTKPIDFAKYYAWVANKLLNQFLEERDTFLETDNLPAGKSKFFDNAKEAKSIIEYAEFVHNNQEAFHKINDFCLEQAELLIKEAKAKNSNGKLTIPEFGALVSMDSNDIIKKNSLIDLDNDSYKEYVLYIKPLQNITNCIKLENRMYDIVSNARVFFNASEEIVDYRSIHSKANVNWKAVNLIKELIKTGLFKGVYFSTHHNGNRESDAKIDLMREILPEANGYIGQRFHDEEHDAKRRDRSSKIKKASATLGVEPSQLVLLDDSKANCGDCKKNGALEVLYKPETDSEIINGRIEETGFNRIMDFDEKTVDFICELCQKHKVKRK